MKSILLSSLCLFLLLTHQQVSAQNWPQLDAVVYNNISDKYYFFYGQYFVIKERGKYIDGLPIEIAEDWDGFPKSWGGGNIDAVCFVTDNISTVTAPGMPKPKGVYYFFKGDEMCSKVMGENMSAVMKINDPKGFPGLPWPRVDAVVFNAITQTYYFFNGNEFTSKKRGEPVSKEVKNISDGWVNLPTDRPIRDVTFSADNKEYYFFWDDFYITKTLGKDILPNSKRKYEDDGESGFKWAERSNNNFVGFANEAGFLTNFHVSWTSEGKPNSWNIKGSALLFEKRLKLPKDATNIKISAYTYDLIKKDDGALIFKEEMNIPPNSWYKVYGTIFKPTYKVDKKSSNILGSVETFFSKDVSTAYNVSMHKLNEGMTEAKYEVVKAMAREDVKRLRNTIETLANASKEVIKDNTFINGLYRASKDKSAERNAAFVKKLLSREEMKKVIALSGFKTLSIGFTADASTVMGAEGAFGYALSMDGTKVKGFAGLDASLGVQSGAGLGCQFGIWTSPPPEMGGPGVGVSVSVGDGLGIGFSLSYNVNFDENNVPSFTFAGISVTPGIGVDLGVAMSSGYGWVY